MQKSNEKIKRLWLKILDSLRKYNCTKIDVNIYQFLYYDEILKACENTLGVKLNNKYRTQLQVWRMLKC